MHSVIMGKIVIEKEVAVSSVMIRSHDISQSTVSTGMRSFLILPCNEMITVNDLPIDLPITYSFCSEFSGLGVFGKSITSI